LEDNGQTGLFQSGYNPAANMKIIRSKRKTIALVIEQDGSLTVRAPQRFSRSNIEQLVIEKAGWIRQRQEWIRLHSTAPHRYEEGELFYYLGKAFPLSFADRQMQPLLLIDTFQLKRPLKTQARKVFIAWYRDQAHQLIGERAAILANRHHLVFKDLHITSARTRWGSCNSRGALNFSWRLVMAPLEVIDYVIIHELAHLKIRNHSSEFWNYVEKLSPNYRTLRKWLKENGGSFNL
jgi:predicted metal-dependent hydrolase